jgi:hypothetical protein
MNVAGKSAVTSASVVRRRTLTRRAPAAVEDRSYSASVFQADTVTNGRGRSSALRLQKIVPAIFENLTPLL